LPKPSERSFHNTDQIGTTRSEKDFDLPAISIERIREDLGFIPEYDLKRAVRAYIDWVRDGKYV